MTLAVDVRHRVGDFSLDVRFESEGRLTALEVAGRTPGDGIETDSDLAPLWQEIAEAVSAVIDRVTFGDLAERARARRSPERAVYHI